MDLAIGEKPHVVCIPYPAQGHINPMFRLAKILQSRGFHITFVHTEYNYQRLLKSRGPESVKDLPDFRFETIPDGLPPTDKDATQDIPLLCQSTSVNCLGPFRGLIAKLNNSSTSNYVTPVSAIISDGVMSFSLQVAEELAIPGILLWTTSFCGFAAYLHYPHLIERGLTPFKDESYLTNGYLNTPIDWIPGMSGICLKDIPSFIRTTDPNDIMLNFLAAEVGRASKASAIIINTFQALEGELLGAIKSHLPLPPIFTIGPLKLPHESHAPKDVLNLDSFGSSLWKEDPECLYWLDTKEPDSVVYVNFGSITVMSSQQLVEFAWGLANSKHTFLWVIRPDLVQGDSAILPMEFSNETKNRSLLVSWCPQDRVLNHLSVGGFLTHSGWNSTIESVFAGVPMICWPFFAEQQTNCWYACVHWGVGMEINSNVRRDDVESLVKELMEGEKGKNIKIKAKEWKIKANQANSLGGTSYDDLDNLIVLLHKKDVNSF